MVFCPGCACSALFHGDLIRIGDETNVRGGNCGPCWKTSGTLFVEVVMQRLGGTGGMRRAS